MLSIQEINLLKSQNEGLKKQNESLQKENKFLKEQNKVIANELDEFIQKIPNAQFEKLLQDNYFKGGCKYLNTFSDCDGYHYYCDLADDIKNEYCEYYKDCYFKQLACKTQECEDLKLILQQSKDNNKSTLLLLAKKNEECEELKSECSELFNAKLEILRDLDHYKRAYYGCSKRIEERLVVRAPLPPPEFVDSRYRKALTEIKEIAEPFCNACQEFEPEKKGSNCMYCNYGKILQKISEVEK